MKKLDLLIMGDSWGLGEWGGDPVGRYGILHGGLGQYATEAGYAVENISRPADCNRSQVDDLLARLERVDLPFPSNIIWFVTDPLRDLQVLSAARVEDDALAMFFRSVVDVNDLCKRRDDLLLAQFRRLCHLDIGLLGGPYPIDSHLLSDLPNLHLVCPNLTQWLAPGSANADTAYVTRTWQWRNMARPLWEHYLELEGIGAEHRHRAEHLVHTPEHRYFWPDGYHINRLAHRRVFVELVLPWLQEPNGNNDHSA